jgi:hypothetical protein
LETTRVTPFYANCGYYPRFEPDLGSVSTEAPEVSEYVTALNNLHAELRAEIAYAQAAHVEQANKTRYPDPVLELGERVWLRRKHVKTTRPLGKLDYKLIGPYTILERVGSRAYKLDLPPSIQLHPVFHISLLEPAEPDSKPIPGHIQPPLPPVIIDNEEEWELEEIVDSRHYRNQLQYRVKWTGFHDQDKAWYPAMNFENSQDTVQQFHTRYPQKPAPGYQLWPNQTPWSPSSNRKRNSHRAAGTILLHLFPPLSTIPTMICTGHSAGTLTALRTLILNKITTTFLVRGQPTRANNTSTNHATAGQSMTRSWTLSSRQNT